MAAVSVARLFAAPVVQLSTRGSDRHASNDQVRRVGDSVRRFDVALTACLSTGCAHRPVAGGRGRRGVRFHPGRPQAAAAQVIDGEHCICIYTAA